MFCKHVARNAGISTNVYAEVQKGQISTIIPLNSGRSLVLWQRGISEVWLNDAELGEQGLGLLVLDAGVHNDIVTRDPVDRGGDAVLVTGLERVYDTENLGGVAASGGGV